MIPDLEAHSFVGSVKALGWNLVVFHLGQPFSIDFDTMLEKRSKHQCQSQDEKILAQIKNTVKWSRRRDPGIRIGIRFICWDLEEETLAV